MEIITENITVIATALAAVLSVLATWQINKRQASTAEKEGDAKVLQIQNDIETALWERAKKELAEKDAEILQLKSALNHLGKEHADAMARIRSLELRLDTGELKGKG